MNGKYSAGMMADPMMIRSVSENLVKLADELRGQLDSLNASKDSLLGIWHGGASTAFSDVYNEGFIKLRNFQMFLESKGSALGDSGSSGVLADAENENFRRAANLED